MTSQLRLIDATYPMMHLFFPKFFNTDLKEQIHGKYGVSRYFNNRIYSVRE